MSGWLLGLPLNSGPVLLFLLLEQGPRFASGAARGSLLGILAWAAFCLAYAFCCLKLSWWWSTLVGWIAYAGAAFALLPVSISVTWAFVLVTVALATILLAFPKAPQSDPPLEQPKPELWLRMAAASVMVVTLTGVARMLGPTRSGILSAFPAYTTILAVFSHRYGPSSAVKAEGSHGWPLHCRHVFPGAFTVLGSPGRGLVVCVGLGGGAAGASCQFHLRSPEHVRACCGS